MIALLLIAHLPELPKSLQVSELAKARWQQPAQPVLEGASPIDWLPQSRMEEVLAEARQVGRGQDCPP